jgi:hypothetical protein
MTHLVHFRTKTYFSWTLSPKEKEIKFAKLDVLGIVNELKLPNRSAPVGIGNIQRLD